MQNDAPRIYISCHDLGAPTVQVVKRDIGQPFVAIEIGGGITLYFESLAAAQSWVLALSLTLSAEEVA